MRPQDIVISELYRLRTSPDYSYVKAVKLLRGVSMLKARKTNPVRINLIVIDKTDPENTQFVCDLKQMQMRLKNEK